MSITALELILNTSAETVKQKYIDLYPLSLMSGKLGIALFFAHYYEWTKQDDYLNLAVEIIEQNFEYISGNNEHIDTFASGIGGLAWVVNYFMQRGWLADDADVLEQFDDYLENIGSYYFSKGNYDYLHGGIGIMLYWLERETGTEYLTTTLETLQKQALQNDKGIYWLSTNFTAKTQEELEAAGKEINFGLSHGMTSIVYLLSKIHQKGICQDICREMIVDTIQFIQNHPSEKDTPCECPSALNVSETGDYTIGLPSRLAWCYGDLGMAVVFLQAGLQLEDNALIEYATALGLKTINRKSFEETMLYDAGICHGTFGVALLYKKLFKCSACLEFEQAADYWLNEGIQHLKTNPIQNYKSKYADKWIEDIGLLTGSAGIGMGILDMLHPEITQTDGTNWDRILLLS